MWPPLVFSSLFEFLGFRLNCSSLTYETILAFFLRVCYTGFTFLSTVLLARFLGVSGYGVYAFAFSLVMLLSTPIHSGIADLILRETAYGIAQNRPDYIKGVWYWAHQVVLAFSFLVIVGGGGSVWWQGNIGAITKQILVASLFLVPFISLVNIYGYILRGLQYTIFGLIPEFFIRPGSFLSLIVFVVYIFKQNMTPFYAILLQVIATVISLIAAVWFLDRKTPYYVKIADVFKGSRGKWFRDGLFFGLLSSVGVVNNQASIIILGLLNSPESVGYYRVATQMANLSVLGLQSVSLVVAPRFAHLWSQGDHFRLQRLVTQSSRLIFLFSVFVVITFLFRGRVFLHFIFGVEFDKSYTPLLILMFGQVINSSTGAVWFLLNMTGFERETFIVMGGAALINVVLGLVLIPLWGIVGASIATSFSVIVWNMWLWIISYKKIGINTFVIARIKVPDTGLTLLD
nr:flippase [Ardenticatena sp.]